jgi:membrane protein implicated in regulation of membrane protease activity
MLLTVLYEFNLMYIKPLNVLIFGLLIIVVGHIMIIQNGYWENSILLITSSSIVILFAIYQRLKNNEKKNKVKRIKEYAEI